MRYILSFLAVTMPVGSAAAHPSADGPTGIVHGVVNLFGTDHGLVAIGLGVAVILLAGRAVWKRARA